MKSYLEHLSKDETKKKEFEAAVNKAIDSVAEKHGFSPGDFQEKKYDSEKLGAWDFTVQVGRTYVACCGGD